MSLDLQDVCSSTCAFADISADINDCSILDYYMKDTTGVLSKQVSIVHKASIFDEPQKSSNKVNHMKARKNRETTLLKTRKR